MTYNVFGETLSLTQSISHSVAKLVSPLDDQHACICVRIYVNRFFYILCTEAWGCTGRQKHFLPDSLPPNMAATNIH